jgi:hypothetical protein
MHVMRVKEAKKEERKKISFFFLSLFECENVKGLKKNKIPFPLSLTHLTMRYASMQ